MRRKKREQSTATDAAIIISTATVDLSAKESLPGEEDGLLPQKTGRLDAGIILALLTAAFAFRFYSLQFYHVISTDGTTYALTAKAIANGDWHGAAISGFYPLLIAGANWLVSDLETAGRLVSVVCGSLLIVPLFYLGKMLFSRKTAIAACFTVIVWPSLVASSCEVMTQSTYTTLQLAAVFLVWRAFLKPSLLGGCLAGVLMGLSYLTRPEAILLSIVIPAVLSLFSLRELRGKRLFFWSYAGSFLLLFTLNMLLVHHVSGEWQLSAKTDSALNDALSYYLNIPDINYIPGYQPKSYLDIITEHPEFLWKNSLHNLRQAWQTILPLPLWFLVFVGVATGGFDREATRRRFFLFATFAPLAVIIVFYYISGGYTEAYLPVLFLFAAAGLAAVENRLKGYVTHCLQSSYAQILQKVPLLLFSAFLFAAMIFAPQLRKNVSDADYRPEMDNGRRAEKHLGVLLKNNLPPGKIMTRWARIAFYADREWTNVPAVVKYDEIIKTARVNGVRFLIADFMLYSMRPELGPELFAPFMDKELPPGLYFNRDPDLRVKGLKPFLVFNDPGGVGVIVYEIPPEKS